MGLRPGGGGQTLALHLDPRANLLSLAEQANRGPDYPSHCHHHSSCGRPGGPGTIQGGGWATAPPCLSPQLPASGRKPLGALGALRPCCPEGEPFTLPLPPQAWVFPVPTKTGFPLALGSHQNPDSGGVLKTPSSQLPAVKPDWDLSDTGSSHQLPSPLTPPLPWVWGLQQL